jgi:hypothetical protein
MILHYINPNRDLKEYNFDEALLASGSSDHDSVFAQDQALEDWLKDKKYCVIEFDVKSYSSQLEIAVAEGIEVVIIKEKLNDPT